MAGPEARTHAIILVGGRGTRLQPLTDSRPKPMLPILGVPFLEYQLEHLRKHGVRDVTFACGFMPQQIIGHFGDGDRLKMHLNYVVEPQPLDTGGAIAFAARGLDADRFIVCNGDILTELDLTEMIAAHIRRSATATIALARVEDPSRYGLVRRDEDDAVLAFVEKPGADEVDTNWINAGTYVLEPACVERIPVGERCNVEREVFPQLVGNGLYGFASDGYWRDIGTVDSYLAANFDVLDGKVQRAASPVVTTSRGSGVEVARSAVIDDDARIVGPVWIGPSVRIGAGARIGPNVVIGEACAMRDGSRVADSVLMERAMIGREAQVVDGVVGEDGAVEAGCSVSDGAVVAPGERVSRPVTRG